MDPDSLRRIRLDRGLTQRELAQLADVHITTIKRLESGSTHGPHIANVRRAAQALGVPLNMLEGHPHDGLPPALDCGRLPVADLIGRDGDLDELCRVLTGSGSHQVVTVCGSRGVGKTALARAVAFGGRAGEAFDRVVWVSAKLAELEPRGISGTAGAVLNLEQILRAIAGACGQPEMGGCPPGEQTALVGAMLAQARTLLVVDNLEALQDDVVDGLVAVLRLLPTGSRALVTSLGPVGIAGEVVYPLPPLGHQDACRLLLREAHAKRVYLSAEDQAAILRTVGGIPVLLLWCVGRMALDGQGAMGVVAGLQRADVDAYAWAFGQLWEGLPSDDCRRILVAAATCVKGAGREHIGEAAGVTDPRARDEALGQLVRRASLLMYDHASGRFTMLPLTRLGALAECEVMPDGYDIWLRSGEYLGQAIAERDSGPNAEWADLANDHDNVVDIADRYCRAQDWTALATLLSRTSQFLYVGYRWADLRRLGCALTSNSEQVDDARLVAGVQRDLAWLHLEFADHASAQDLASRALRTFERLKDYASQATCLRCLAQVAIRDQRYGQAERHLRQASAAASRARPNGYLLAMVDNLWGAVRMETGDYAGARACFTRSLKRRGELEVPDRFGMCAVLRNLGELALRQGQEHGAAQWLNRCIRLCDEVSRQDLKAGASLLLARLRRQQGRIAEARELALLAQAIFGELGVHSELRAAEALLDQLGAGE